MPWPSVHTRTDHFTFWPKHSVHPTNRLLWQFSTVTFHPKLDGLSIHLKLWQSNLVNLNGLSQCDKPTDCNILSQSLWHFVCALFIQICCDFSSQHNKRSIFPEYSAIFTHFHMWHLILTGPCMSLRSPPRHGVVHMSLKTTVSWDFLKLFFLLKAASVFLQTCWWFSINLKQFVC